MITGTTLGESPSKNNSDAKFQISMKYRLSNKPVFDNIYCFITYTQKSFWDIYRDSSPFDDINFNPGLGLIKPYMNKKGRLGYYSLIIEHESNGKDSLASRSWNFVSFNWSAELNRKLLIEAKSVIPFGSTLDNPDLFKYIGYGDLGFTYIFKPRRLYAKIILKKGASRDWKGSVETQLFFRPSETSNLYLMLQGFHGYGENLLEYNKQVSKMRIGVVIKPNFMNFF
ncbi:phospholipase A [Mucilaginibacter sp. HMF5004]|uniref:phospholipase A n=1 Tax=Mucilaginibacter rivuli TaxID=2857527 RepID=UPI001C5CD941|nr:phospholipase A [Mucilaginibacter rivuli]MBW4888922.1 phospholipase A [Mucilaginibacter rivuli]